MLHLVGHDGVHELGDDEVQVHHDYPCHDCRFHYVPHCEGKLLEVVTYCERMMMNLGKRRILLTEEVTSLWMSYQSR